MQTGDLVKIYRIRKRGTKLYSNCKGYSASWTTKGRAKSYTKLHVLKQHLSYSSGESSIYAKDEWYIETVIAQVVAIEEELG